MVSQNSTDNTVQDNDFSVNRSAAGTTVQSSTNHTDNTSASSDAKFLVKTGGSSGGDSHINFNVAGTQDYSIGIDNSDSDNLKITDGATPSSGTTYITFPQGFTSVLVNGISFDNGTNVMNAYEEGAWTPKFEFGGGTSGITYSGSTVGAYVRMGRVVCCSFTIELTSKGTSTGNATLAGLPFPLGASDNGTSAFSMRQSFINFSANHIVVFSVLLGTTTTVPLIQDGPNVAFASLTDTNFNNNTGLSASFWYFA